jgi:hypothetical protein
MRSIRLDPELDELVKRAAAQEGASVSEFLRRAAVDRAHRTLQRRDQLQDVIGSVRTRGGVARQTGTAFGDLLGRRAPQR